MKEGDNNLKIRDIKPIDLDKCERMQKIIRYYKMSQTELAERLDVNQSNLSAIIRGKRPCGKIMDDKFLLSFPEINREWFLTGTGDMLNEGYTTFDPVGVATPTTPTAMAETEKEVVLLKAKLEEKEKMIELLKQQLEELNNINKGLMTTLTNVATSRTSSQKVADE